MRGVGHNLNYDYDKINYDEIFALALTWLKSFHY